MEEEWTKEEKRAKIGRIRRNRKSPRYLGINYPDWKDDIVLYSRLESRMVRTRYHDDETLIRLGTKNDVDTLFGRVGIQGFMNARRPTTYALTMEFLLSYDVYTEEDDRLPSGCTFILRGRNTKTTRKEMNLGFGSPYDASDEINAAFDKNAFWNKITGRNEAFNPRKSKSSSIINVKRVLSNTIFARHEEAQLD